MKTEKDWDAQVDEIGSSAMASIQEMVDALEEPEQDDDGEDIPRTIDGDEVTQEEARERIQDDALSVEIVWGNSAVGEAPEAEGYEILLTTGGPAVKIVGDLDRYKQPDNARLMVQDWFKPWAEYMGADRSALLAYAQCFYYGD